MPIIDTFIVNGQHSIFANTCFALLFAPAQLHTPTPPSFISNPDSHVLHKSLPCQSHSSGCGCLSQLHPSPEPYSSLLVLSVHTHFIFCRGTFHYLLFFVIPGIFPHAQIYKCEETPQIVRPNCKPFSESNWVERKMEEGSDLGTHLNYRFRSMSALEILRETVRILRFNCAGLVLIAAFLICPVSAVQMSNFLVDQSVVRRLAIRLLLIARTSGLPLTPVVKQSCQRFSEMAISSAVCFPLYATLLLLSKAAVVYSVDCTYSMKQFDVFKFCKIVRKLWKRVIMTYIWACMVIVGVITLFLVLLVAICNTFLIFGFVTDVVVYLAMVVGLVFSVVFAKAIIVSNIAVVISVLEDASGPQALLRSTVLIRGQTQVGLLMYLGSTMGMTFVQGLFEHRVKTLSYGDGSSRIWEGPLLVIMYSFVVLIDLMMTAVFYFSCWSFSMEAANQEAQSILEMATTTPTKGHSVPIETAAG